MLEVIGFEGHSGDAPMNFGAAAISDSASVWNVVTGAKCTKAKWCEYIDDQVVTVVKPHGPLPGAVLSLPCFVLRSRSFGPAAVILVAQLDMETDKCLAAWADLAEGWRYWLFPSFEILKAFTTRVAPMLFKYAEEGGDPDASDIRSQAFVLDHDLNPLVRRLRSEGKNKNRSDPGAG